jgi:hypothetical protein
LRWFSLHRHEWQNILHELPESPSHGIAIHCAKSMCACAPSNVGMVVDCHMAARRSVGTHYYLTSDHIVMGNVGIGQICGSPPHDNVCVRLNRHVHGPELAKHISRSSFPVALTAFLF